MFHKCSVVLLISGCAAGCSARPAVPLGGPSAAGAQLAIPAGSEWRYEGFEMSVSDDGWISIDQERAWFFDGAGSIFDTDGERVAFMFDDGRVVGADDRDLGRVGGPNAAPPERSTAWLSVEPSGRVVRFDSVGRRHDFGAWEGCAERESCVYIAHVFGLELRALLRERTPSLTMGIRSGPGITRPHGLSLPRDMPAVEARPQGPW